MLRFFTAPRLALNPNLILEIGSILHLLSTGRKAEDLRKNRNKKQE
jgi:hypothetical protein